jgi:hypothetical protein
MQKSLFPGTFWVHAGTCVFGQFLRAGCVGAAWVRGGSLGSGMGARRRCLSQRAGDVRWSSPPCHDEDACRRCAGERDGSWSTLCLRVVRGRACVGAWVGEASGGSFGAFVPVPVWAITRLLSGGLVLYGKVSNNAYSQGSQEFSASAGAYRPGSLTDAQEPAVACPPRTSLCDPASYLS